MAHNRLSYNQQLYDIVDFRIFMFYKVA